MQNQVEQHTQPPAVAGLFYPADAHVLRGEVDQLLAQALPSDSGSGTHASPPRALIVPHAGYIYSGAVAAAAYARTIPWAAQISRVVVFAPAHRVPFSGMAVASADFFSTPLGKMPVDLITRGRLLEGDFQVDVIDPAFVDEHALEVQLPFMQRILDDFMVLPILVGDVSPEAVKKVMHACRVGPETLLVVSSDLSHFHDYQTAEQMDRHTTQEIEALNPQGIGYDDACGRIPVSGLLLEARQQGWQVKTVARCNSGDTAGDRHRVVGYGAYVFS